MNKIICILLSVLLLGATSCEPRHKLSLIHILKEALKEYTHFGMEGGLTFIMNNKIYLQIISGRGPAECFRAVDLVLEKILKHARELKLEAEVLEREQGEIDVYKRQLFIHIITPLFNNFFHFWK